MEILVHFDMWNENRKILSSIFHFTIPPSMKILKNEAKFKVGFVWTFFQKTKWTWICDVNLKGQVPNPKNMATVEV